jgi:hypothetical protein
MTALSIFLQIGQQTFDPLEIGGVYNSGLSQISFPLGALLGEDMAGKGLAADNLAGAGALEPLGSPSVCFHLWHGVLSLFHNFAGLAAPGCTLYVPATFGRTVINSHKFSDESAKFRYAASSLFLRARSCARYAEQTKKRSNAHNMTF